MSEQTHKTLALCLLPVLPFQRWVTEREVHSIRVSALSVPVPITAQIASSSDLLPETLAQWPVAPSHSCYAASRHPFPYISVSGPDLPSPCSLIFSLSPYSTFFSAPNIQNPPVTRCPLLPLLPFYPPPSERLQSSYGSVVVPQAWFYSPNCQGRVSKWQDKTGEIWRKKGKRKDGEREANTITRMHTASSWCLSLVRAKWGKRERQR